MAAMTGNLCMATTQGKIGLTGVIEGRLVPGFLRMTAGTFVAKQATVCILYLMTTDTS